MVIDQLQEQNQEIRMWREKYFDEFFVMSEQRKQAFLALPSKEFIKMPPGEILLRLGKLE